MCYWEEVPLHSTHIPQSLLVLELCVCHYATIKYAYVTFAQIIIINKKKGFQFLKIKRGNIHKRDTFTTRTIGKMSFQTNSLIVQIRFVNHIFFSEKIFFNGFYFYFFD